MEDFDIAADKMLKTPDSRLTSPAIEDKTPKKPSKRATKDKIQKRPCSWKTSRLQQVNFSPLEDNTHTHTHTHTPHTHTHTQSKEKTSCSRATPVLWKIELKTAGKGDSFSAIEDKKVEMQNSS